MHYILCNTQKNNNLPVTIIIIIPIDKHNHRKIDLYNGTTIYCDMVKKIVVLRICKQK